jgi:mono/diheme cytochrome c family protein
MNAKISRRLLLCLSVAGLSLPAALPVLAADDPEPIISVAGRRGGFVEADGPTLYRAICQGCHMPGGIGASGAGAYPALANNVKLAASAYIVYNVVNGRRGMPGFGQGLSDAQVAAVVNYVRSNFGNHYTDVVTPADVAKLR